MGTISKLPLSESAQGKPIQISAISSPGDQIHTTEISDTTIDEIWLYCTNNDTSVGNVTIEYGATGAANEINIGIPAQSGLSILLPGLVLTGDGTSGSTISAYASDADIISIVGYVNRIEP